MLESVADVEGLDDQGFMVPATHRRVFGFSRDGIRRSLEESLVAAVEVVADDRKHICFAIRRTSPSAAGRCSWPASAAGT